jgi:hypothetical protein
MYFYKLINEKELSKTDKEKLIFVANQSKMNVADSKFYALFI